MLLPQGHSETRPFVSDTALFKVEAIKPLCIKMMGQCNFSIAPIIYHFMIYYMSFAALKNLGILRMHLHNQTHPLPIFWIAFASRFFFSAVISRTATVSAYNSNRFPL